MHYVVSDIHNDNHRLCELLKTIFFSKGDTLILLGDLFNRCDYAPDPVGVYFTVLGLGSQCIVLRGNHDEWLSKYILDYFGTPERKRKYLVPYTYNSFELIRRRLTPVDMQELAHWIQSKPRLFSMSANGINYLFAHDMETLLLNCKLEQNYFLEKGADGYISMFGHTSTSDHRIWKNERRNVYCVDCGCGYRSGSLGAICLETGEEVYI